MHSFLNLKFEVSCCRQINKNIGIWDWLMRKKGGLEEGLELVQNPPLVRWRIMKALDFHDKEGVQMKLSAKLVGLGLEKRSKLVNFYTIKIRFGQGWQGKVRLRKLF